MKTLLKWILGICCSLFGILFLQISIISGVLFLVASLFLIPPTFDKINASGKINRSIKIIVPVIAILGAIIIGGKANSAQVEHAMKKITEKQNQLTDKEKND